MASATPQAPTPTPAQNGSPSGSAPLPTPLTSLLSTTWIWSDGGHRLTLDSDGSGQILSTSNFSCQLAHRFLWSIHSSSSSSSSRTAALQKILSKGAGKIRKSSLEPRTINHPELVEPTNPTDALVQVRLAIRLTEPIPEMCAEPPIKLDEALKEREFDVVLHTGAWPMRDYEGEEYPVEVYGVRMTFDHSPFPPPEALTETEWLNEKWHTIKHFYAWKLTVQDGRCIIA